MPYRTGSKPPLSTSSSRSPDASPRWSRPQVWLVRAIGLLAVSTQSPDDLERAVAGIEQAIQASCETHRLRVHLAQAFPGRRPPAVSIRLTRVSIPLHAARTQRDLATVLGASGNGDAAEKVRAQAMETFRIYGVRELAELKAELFAANVQPL